MNYHFTTTKAHFEMAGGKVLELFGDEALNTDSTVPFKGNMDLDKLEAAIAEARRRARSPSSAWRPPPTSSAASPSRWRTCRAVKAIAAAHGIPVVLDASLISENAYFIKQRETGLRRTAPSRTSSGR